MLRKSPYRKIRPLMIIVVIGLCAMTTVAVTQAAGVGFTAVTHKATVKHKKTVKKTHGLKAPRLLTPANGAQVQQVPSLTWSAVSGAVEYQYEISADPRFHSIILGAGGTGIRTTHNLAASLEKPVTDGTYYWRVRGITATQSGSWSVTRSVVKAWTESPQLVGPGEGTEIEWPSAPLVLHWSEVPYAYEYIVTIATDERLTNIVVGSATSPVKTQATVFALNSTLQAGQTYYWGITPVDAEGHRGTPSRVGKFTWSWPTTTATSLTPLNSEPGETNLKWTPEFTWNPVPGAARYEVEVSSAEGFPADSIWYSGTTIGTTASPLLALNNNEYFWRVRAVDASGHTGVWNEGPRFTKAFDDETPTIHNLMTTDVQGNPTPEDPTTGTPVVKWSPVPGAASYEVEVLPVKKGCGTYEVSYTPSPAWTPIAAGTHLGQANWPSPQAKNVTLTPGESYCVQVAARSDVDAFSKQIESTLTRVNEGRPAFKYEPRVTRCTHALQDERTAREDEEKAKGDEEKGDASGAAELKLKAAESTEAAKRIYNTYEFLTPAECEGEIGPTTEVSRYILPKYGSTETRAPLFTWEHVPGAECYYVAISRDPLFTNVVDVAKTYGTAYAPPVGDEEPLDDETTSYYWSVFPVAPESPAKTCEGPPIGSTSNQSVFDKSSVPPTPLSPVGGVEVSNQPTFKWGPAEGALNYTLEVSASPTFDNLIDDVKTDSTSYTSSSTYPANETLYWRVRANDTNRTHEGLNWSAPQAFRRTLLAPQPLASNPTSGAAIPVLGWTPVTGAVGYEEQEESPNGTTKAFTFDSPAETASVWAGPGIWRWKIRALFPTASSSTVPGPFFSPAQSFAHTVVPPTGAAGVKSGSRIVISWNPQAYAKQYEVAISTNETFSSTIETHKVTETSWAPNVDFTKSANKGTLYWRVAAIDKLGNIGPYATGMFVPPKPKCVVKRVKVGKKTVKKCVVPKPAKKKAKKKKHG